MTRRAARPMQIAMATALAACQVAPEGSTADDVTFFREAVATIGCTLETDADFRTVEFQAALSRAQVLAIAGQELGAGRAERLESGGIRLTSGPCAPGATPPVQPLEIAEAAE